MSILPYDRRVARILVRPLARASISPNQITACTLVLALAAAWLFAGGEAALMGWGAGLFMLARFLDHFDGELARLDGASSRFGYYFDYVTGAISYTALFAGLGLGLRHGELGDWALVLGAAGATSAIISLFLNLALDRELELGEDVAVGYPSAVGFELEDGVYLIGPMTWLGWLAPFFVACGVGALVYCAWSACRLLGARKARRRS